MKVADILVESSSLNSLGVDPKVMSDAHTVLGIKHDERFEPVANKAELLRKMQARHTVVVVGASGSAVIAAGAKSGYYTMVLSGERGYPIYPSGTAREVLSKAGRGQYFTSVTSRPSYDVSNPRSRKYTRDDNEKEENLTATYDAIASIYGDYVRKAATEALQRVKHRYMDAVENNDKWELQRLQQAVVRLKDIREKGYPADAWGYFGKWFDAYLRSVDKQAVGIASVPINRDTIKDMVSEPLFKQKYIKFVLNTIRSIEEGTSSK